MHKPHYSIDPDIFVMLEFKAVHIFFTKLACWIASTDPRILVHTTCQRPARSFGGLLKRMLPGIGGVLSLVALKLGSVANVR